MTSRTIPLDQLLFGHEADPPINARRVGREDEIAAYADSIAAHGLIQALSIRMIDGVPFVSDGNKRLAALRKLVDDGRLAADHPIKVDDIDDDADALEISLAANIMRAPLHEADQLETFSQLVDAGMGETAIASRFGIEPQRVRKILALGRLSPMILQAWRDGDLDQYGHGRGPADTVRAFTLAPSIEEQERVFKKLSKDGQLWPHIIRHEFGAGDRDAGKHLELIGKEAYIKAGGQVIEDLFGDSHVVSDKALLAKLLAEKLQAKVDEALKDGWSWAALADDLPDNWSWGWQKLGLSKKKATKEQKAKSGVVVGLDYNEKLEVTYGVVKPEAAKKEKAAAGEKGEKAAPTISNAMHQRLSAQATLATRAALKQEPRLGLVALLAGFIAHRHLHTDSPVRAYHDGFGRSYGEDKESFASAFERLSAMSDAELFVVAAGCAGEAVHMERPHTGRLPFDDNAAPLAAAIDADRMTAALLEHFDSADYFGGVAKPFVITAIREAINDDEARKAEKLKKKELVEYAVANVPGTGWLPPELRCATYSGPGAMAEAPAMAEAAE